MELLVPDSAIWRASNVNLISQTDITAGWEPLQVDLFPYPRPGRHYIVTSIAAAGIFMVNPVPLSPMADSSVSGIFIVPINESPESLADAQAGVNMAARGHRLHCEWIWDPIGTLYSFVCCAPLMQAIPLPAGYTIRFIACAAPGTPTPGPGAGSSASLSAIICDEANA